MFLYFSFGIFLMVLVIFSFNSGYVTPTGKKNETKHSYELYILHLRTFKMGQNPILNNIAPQFLYIYYYLLHLFFLVFFFDFPPRFNVCFSIFSSNFIGVFLGSSSFVSVFVSSLLSRNTFQKSFLKIFITL